MVLRTLNGKRLGLSLAIFGFTLSATYSQTLPAPGRCSVSSVPTQVRAEGLTETMGNIQLQCSGALPGSVFTGSLTVYLPVSVTNRVDANNLAQDTVLSADSGSGYTATANRGLVSSNSISFNGLSFTIPASGNLNLQISSLRGAASQLGATFAQPILASISFFIPLNQSQVVVAYAQAGLYSLAANTSITCTGSPVPGSIDMADLFAAGTAFVSTRLTEGFGTAFQPRGASDDSGTRFLISYSGFPANTQLFVPNYVAGSSATAPTRGGDLGGPQSGGQYLPGSGTLLLALVVGADSTGAGGTPMAAPTGSGAVTLNSASTITLSNGAGYAVYEVMDANNSILEDAQFPTFIGLTSVTAPASAQESVSFAPVSAVMSASQTAPVPRFVATAPANDCSLVGDCSAGYMPALSVMTQGGPFQQTVVAGQTTTEIPGQILVHNTGGGVMNWTATAVYLGGPQTGWVQLDNSGGQQGGTIRVWAKPQNLTPGAYSANLVIDGGPIAGNFTVPLSLTVQAAPTVTGAGSGGSGSGSGSPGSGSSGSGSSGAAATPQVKVSAVVNAATFQATPLVPGSLGTLMGSNFSGQKVTVTFDGNSAQLLYTSATQINLVVPASAGASSSQSNMVVTVDGASSAPVIVQLAPAWPSVFSNGVLNQDYSVNTANRPAKAGDVLQIFATGIPADATVSAKISGQSGLVPLYAGAAPGVPGVQQVNVAIPGGTASGPTTLTLCVASGGQPYCSTPSTLNVR